MEEEKEQPAMINFEAGIVERIEILIATKKAENDSAIGRLNTMETSWRDVNTALDKEIRTAMNFLDDEAEAIEDAKKRLQRNICLGVDKNKYGIAGKLIDMDSKTGLPGLGVKVARSEPRKEEYLIEETTDSYGNFSIALVLKEFKISEGEPIKLRFDIFSTIDKIVHTEDKQVTPTSGKIDHITLTVKCTGELKEVRDFGKQVIENVEGDAALVKSRTLNMKAAYTAYGRLTETTLSFIGDLKDEIAVSPPNIIPLMNFSSIEEEKETRYLGNSNTRELHDLQNETENCRINQITFDHRLYFETPEQAVQAGYDFCAYCFGKDKSKR